MKPASSTTIDSVNGGVKQILEHVKQAKEHSRNPSGSHSFGFWFRGQVRPEWKIVPGIFRDGTNYNESSMFNHFRLMTPEQRSDQQSEMDWLALMQHHALPTRLVDWTENLLVAFFFATWNPAEDTHYDEVEGKIHVLAARKLNEFTTGHRGIFAPESYHTVLRSTQACADDVAAWRFGLSQARIDPRSDGARNLQSLVKGRGPLSKALSYPIAVFPHRNNRRLVAQAGAFTLHGGKAKAEGGFLQPGYLESLNAECTDEQRFLWTFNVKDKETIRKDLSLLGIHAGTIFPDLDYQSRYLRTIWNMSKDRP